MLLKKIIFSILILFLPGVCVLWAGDSAVFVDLGFSPDGRTYIFGQHGVLSPTLHPWADLYIVDVEKNAFVPNGRVSLSQKTPISAGQDGFGILQQLITKNTSLTNKYSMNFQKGLPLYISREENPAPRGERIEFRDFLTGSSYEAQLIPTTSGSGKNTSSKFYINLKAFSVNGQIKTYTIGAPNYARQRITQYNIKRVLIDEKGSSLIFVIEMKRVADSGHDIRYMVEAVKL